MKCKNILTVMPDQESQELDWFKDIACTKEDSVFSFGSFFRIPSSLFVSPTMDIAFDTYHGNWERVANIEWIKEKFSGLKPFNRNILIQVVEDHFPIYSKAEADIRKVNFDKHGAIDKHDWCLKNWGTSMEASQPTCDETDCLVYTFNTNWNPPLIFIQKCASLFPTLRFELDYECGNDAGRAVAHGEIFENTCWSGKI